MARREKKFGEVIYAGPVKDSFSGALRMFADHIDFTLQNPKLSPKSIAVETLDVRTPLPESVPQGSLPIRLTLVVDEEYDEDAEMLGAVALSIHEHAKDRP